MSEKSQALRLINNLLADIREPDFIWQVVALLACIGSALLIARWWRSRHEEGSGRLNDASARLAFPLTGMVLTGIALTTLDNFLNTHLLKLAMPLLGSMALVRGVIFVLRQAFPQATWLTAWERIIAAMVWGWLALYITDLAPYVIDAMEKVQFHIGKQHVDLWTVLRGIVTIFLTVVFALWVAGFIEAGRNRRQVGQRLVLARPSLAGEKAPQVGLGHLRAKRAALRAQPGRIGGKCIHRQLLRPATAGQHKRMNGEGEHDGRVLHGSLRQRL